MMPSIKRTPRIETSTAATRAATATTSVVTLPKLTAETRAAYGSVEIPYLHSTATVVVRSLHAPSPGIDWERGRESNPLSAANNAANLPVVHTR